MLKLLRRRKATTPAEPAPSFYCDFYGPRPTWWRDGVVVAGDGDTTPEVDGSSYDPGCHYCWLNVPHSETAHGTTL